LFSALFVCLAHLLFVVLLFFFFARFSLISSSCADDRELKRRRAKLARPLYERALTLTPENAELNGNFANLLRSLKEFDLAEKHYQESLRLDPNKVLTLINYALFLRCVRNDRVKADELYQRACITSPKQAQVGVFRAFSRTLYVILLVLSSS
jgi:tetratricopeptide (TPR) repeat protein